MILKRINLICPALIIFLVCIQLIPEQIFAQNQIKPFERISIKMNYLSNVNRNFFHHFWEPEPGAELAVEFPFYVGKIGGGIQILPYKAKQYPQVDFLSQFYYVAWGFNMPMIQPIVWKNEMKIGSYRMDFDDDQINVTQQTESEIGIGISSGLLLSLSTNWQIKGRVEYIKVYTKKRLELVFISAGFCFEFDTPDWLQDFLR